MPTVGQLLLIVTLAASADMMTIMCMESDVGRSQLAGNNEYWSCRHSHDYNATTTSSSSGTCSSLKLPPWSIWNIITVANFEPGPCHWTLEVGTGLNHSKVCLYALVIKSGMMRDDISADRLLAVLQDT